MAQKVIFAAFVASVIAQDTTDDSDKYPSSFLEVKLENTCQLDSQCTVEMVYGENPKDNKFYNAMSAQNDAQVCCATFPRMVIGEDGMNQVTMNKYCYDTNVLSVWETSPYKQAFCVGGASGLTTSIMSLTAILAYQLF